MAIYCTMVNDDLWTIYLQALEELKNSPGKYDYEQETAAPLIEELSKMADSSQWEENLLSMYVDSAKDIYIRADYYALYVINQYPDAAAPFEEVSLNDIIVILQDWENGLGSFSVYKKGSDSEYSLFQAGYNCFTDLELSRQYVSCRNISGG